MAFLDILAPPYGEDRDCKYYKDITTSDANIHHLCVSNEPNFYYTVDLPYTGPALQPYLKTE